MEWITIELLTDRQRINSTDFIDTLIFHLVPSSGKSLKFSAWADGQLQKMMFLSPLIHPLVSQKTVLGASHLV